MGVPIEFDSPFPTQITYSCPEMPFSWACQTHDKHPSYLPPTCCAKESILKKGEQRTIPPGSLFPPTESLICREALRWVFAEAGFMWAGWGVWHVHNSDSQRNPECAFAGLTWFSGLFGKSHCYQLCRWPQVGVLVPTRN